jgi:hypothetical protein
MEIASALGMHAVNSAAPILAELSELSELSEQPAGQAEVFRTH